MDAATPFDVAAAVADFAKDVDQTTLELPAMDAASRKLAKAIVDQYADLSCKTFGLGADRCLHVFKADVCGSPVQKEVSVKNTFIDDWISGVEQEKEGAAFRSLPVQLPGQPEVPPVLPAMHPTSADKAAGEGKPSMSLSRSKFGKQLDFSPIGEGEVKWPKDKSGERQLPTLLPGCQVRNTFIHVDPGDDSDDQSTDERSIQSMPHDMFRMCLEEDATRHGKRTVTSKAAPTSVPCDVHPTIKPGMLVTIQGLTKLPAFNGKSGIVESYDSSTGRYSVALAAPVPGCPRRAKVKVDNLKLQAALTSTSPFPLRASALNDGTACLEPSEIPSTPQGYATPMMLKGYA